MLQWKDWAAQEIVDGYSGSPWQAMLDRHLRSLFPELVKELEATGDYQSYLIVKTANAVNGYVEMIQQGTPPMMAKELTMAELLPVPPDELEE